MCEAANEILLLNFLVEDKAPHTVPVDQPVAACDARVARPSADGCCFHCGTHHQNSMSLTRSIDTDAARRALAAALVQFVGEDGSQVIAEGVETSGEHKALRALGVTRAQGFLGRPATLESAVRPCRSSPAPDELVAG